MRTGIYICACVCVCVFMCVWEGFVCVFVYIYIVRNKMEKKNSEKGGGPSLYNNFC